MGRRSMRRTLVALVATVAIVATASLLPLPSAFGQIDHTIDRWWQYDPSVWHHGFSQHPRLVDQHQRWHDNHRDAGASRHEQYHKELARAHRRMHYHEALRSDTGDATWYDADGGTGACGKTLRGMYVAHRTWACGSLVSVRANGKYVFVRVLDRGPYGEGRIVDLSHAAFRKLAPLSQGVIDVHAVKLKR